MKPRDAQISSTNPLAISIPEVALILGYFFAVWLIPTSWLNTAMGAIAFAIASKINPYLSDFSIAFAADPQYFVHCHVLATWLFPTLLPYLVITRNGGRARYANTWRELHEKWGGWVPHSLFSALIFGLMYFSMVWLVDYPLRRGERAIWIGGVAPSALVIQCTLGIGITVIYMSIYSALSNRRGNNELQ
ncbi:hypothetical protein [Rhodoferax sp. U11-2br]|uniref:hypothetical protein n=1 Tax=Rhodoferax sp. U11-2br TaxID=2838878 RepID=UPI001BE55AAB|nr:hypothetical protein [Rhodoferax sp. U11-2br]MBT3068006.1 hypothetical protein [Rhodoferax sp. U11-2br]